MTSSPPPTATPIRETAYSETLRVDRAAGIIRGVKILGRESRNGRVYSDAALDQAAMLYEGLGVNVDHPPQENGEVVRRLADGFGHLQNVARRGDGVYGDLVFLRAHALAEQVCEAAERMPEQFGLSHNADGLVVHRDGQWLVESITRVRSVDLVRNPATNRSLFESRQPESDCEHSALLSILNEGRIEDAEKIRRVRTLLTGQPSGGRSKQESLSDTDFPTLKRLHEALGRLERRMQVRELLEEYGLSPEPALMARLASLADESAMRLLLEAWPSGTRLPLAESPRSRESRASSPSRLNHIDLTDNRAVAAYLRN